MTKRLNLILLALLALIGGPYYWLLLETGSGDAQPKAVSVAQLDRLASSMPGPAPSGIEVELAAFRRLPGNLVAAGTGMKRVMVGAMAFRLPVDGKGPIVIDSGMTQGIATCMDMQAFYPAAQARISSAMESAGLVLLTHEHADHIGGLIAESGTAGGAAAMKVARFGAGQTAPSGRCQIPWPRGVAPAPTIPASGPMAVAPGVVAIPAPSHTPGSQMIFVRLANGRRYLFAGDIATMDRNWRDLRARSRLVGDYIAPEDRKEVFSWLLTIRKLKQENPGLTVIPGHDFEWIAANANKTGVVGTMR